MLSTANLLAGVVDFTSKRGSDHLGIDFTLD